MGASSSKSKPKPTPIEHPVGPERTLRKRRETETPLRVMLRVYRSRAEKDLALRFLETAKHMACEQLIDILAREILTNIERRRDRPDRELILATNKIGPTSVAGYAFIEYRKRGVYVHLLEACYKKRGIGSILLDYAIDRAKAAGARFIDLVSVDDPATLRFYESKGFLRGPYGSRSGVKPTNWKQVDYSSSNNDEKKEQLPKLHLIL
jgi:GNAT superfamily N-acetyltransferase